ncbi:family 20 glycosylhydrolase [Microbacterium sp. JZ70]
MPLPLTPWPRRVTPGPGSPLQLAARTRGEAITRARSAIRHADDPTIPREGYALRVDADGIAVRSSDAAGAAYAAATLAQLVECDDTGSWVIRAVEIEDAPRFPYRGAMLDVARHFHPVPTVAWFIDRLAELKLNHLHLHLTDDQGWRIALRSRPDLVARGSATATGGDAGGFYTQDDWQAILAHAAARHVTVVPEIDLPGHTHAVGLAHPELMAPPVVSDDVRETTRRLGGSLPEPGVPYTGLAVGFSSLRPLDAEVDAFLVDVLGELCAITPGPFVHIGGDEALGTAPEDYAALTARAARIVADAGKTPIAWHEAASAPLPDDAIGQYWGFLVPTDGHDAKAHAFADRGGLILSPADAVYLDMKYDERTPIGLTWANGPTSIERSYRWEPDDVVPGLPARAIRGVEAPLWTETVRDRQDIERLVFPRIASAAEIAWSTARDPERTWPAYRARLAELVSRWEDDGIRVGAIVPTS